MDGASGDASLVWDSLALGVLWSPPPLSISGIPSLPGTGDAPETLCALGVAVSPSPMHKACDDSTHPHRPRRSELRCLGRFGGNLARRRSPHSRS